MYKIIGQDGKEYGPVSAGQIKQWIAENRVERRTPIFVDGASDWNFVGLLPEFAGLFSPHPPTITPLKTGIARINSFAVAGMIFGILSLTLGLCCCYGFPFNIPGLIFSAVGLSEINRNPQLQEGRGMAIAGLILSIASLVLAFALLVFSLTMQHSHVIWNFRRF